MKMPFVPNEGKELNINTDYGEFIRYPIKTHVVMKDDNLFKMMDDYVKDYLTEGDFCFISEKIVAISQGRAFHIDDIKPSWWAKFLSKFVYKTPYGIGLGSPFTMELALREIGLLKILFASFASAVTKLFGIRGVFYRILGTQARAIDGPCNNTIPPYNQYAKLAPLNPNKVANELAEHTGQKVVIIDANDLGVEVLGRSDEAIEIDFCKQVFKDNPLDQSAQQTPLCIVRKVQETEFNENENEKDNNENN